MYINHIIENAQLYILFDAKQFYDTCFTLHIFFYHISINSKIIILKNNIVYCRFVFRIQHYCNDNAAVPRRLVPV